MAINPVSMTSESIKTNTEAVIEIVYYQPDPNTLLPVAETPGKLIGSFNGSQGIVNLYVVDNSGLRLLRIS